MNPEFIDKIKDGLGAGRQLFPGVDNTVAAGAIADALNEATGGTRRIATGDILALADAPPPSSVASYAEAVDTTELETGFRASDALTSLANVQVGLDLSRHMGLKRSELSAISSAGFGSSGILASAPKTNWPRGESAVLAHVDELPYIIQTEDTASQASLIEHEVPRADDPMLLEALTAVPEGTGSVKDIRSASEELNTMLKDLQRMRKHYPVVAGRVVHLKKRTSKTRKKK